MKIAVLLLLLSPLVISACADELAGDATISLVLDSESLDSGCLKDSCADYGMSCGSTIMMRLTDATTGLQLNRNDDMKQPFFLCVEADSSDTLCSLSDLASELTLFDVPPENSRVEVAIFSSDDVPGGCSALDFNEPYKFFDALGRPQSNVFPQPAFAGAVYFRAGSTRALSVPLACPNPALLVSSSCEANRLTEVIATVRDIETVRTIRKEDASSLTVRIGEARERTDEKGNTFFALDPQDTDELPLVNDSEVPQYSNKVLLSEKTIVCTTVLETVPEATPSVSCENYDLRSDPFETQPVLVRKELVDMVVTALAIGGFPEDGIVIGRVVDESFQPIAGAQVFPQSGNVLYLSEDLTTLSNDSSSVSGYFVSMNTTFGSQWTALDQSGHEQSGSPVAGLIRGKTSSILIRMTGDVISQ